MSKSTISITGDPKTIYNIARELRVRVTRGLVEVSGDTDKPKNKAVPAKTEDKPHSKMNKDELQVEVKKLKGITDKEIEAIMKKTKKNIVKDIKAWTPPSPKVKEEQKEEKPDVETKEEKQGAEEDKKKATAK